VTNIVLVHTDDTGRYLEPYGYDVPAPNLQRVADDGVRFRRAVCAAPTCSPSRGALMTGQSPHSNGLIGLTHRGFSLDDHGQHLVRHLSRHGYETALCGQQHEAEGESRRRAAREKLGYRVFPDDPGPVDGFEAPHERAREDYANARAAAAYVREDHEDPYFLSVGLYNTHRPFPLDDPAVDPAAVRPPGPIPDVPAARRDVAGYVTSAGFVDDCVGHVYDALRESGQLAETVFVFTTDHGPAFPYMKCNLSEGGVGVALIARVPDGPRGEVVDGLVSQIDLFPTFCDYLDVETPDYVEGTSALPLVTGAASSIRDEAFGEVTYHAAYEPKRCVRTERYTYVRRFDEEYTTTVLPNVDDGPTKQFLLEHGLGDRERPREALYDRYHDPAERDNLVDDPAHADVYEDLRGRLETWMRETDDPLLDGAVPKPPGARINERDCVQPGEERYEAASVR
jgi:arylsulfatase A-like enzyme